MKDVAASRDEEDAMFENISRAEFAATVARYGKALEIAHGDLQMLHMAVVAGDPRGEIQQRIMDTKLLINNALHPPKAANS